MTAPRRPDWLKVKLPGAGRYAEVQRRLGQLGLNTVCREARCPNLGECWGSGTATLMILGRVCTRGCRFCDVSSGQPEPPDANEPRHVAEAIERMGLRYAVLTSVDRDDLADGGAAHFCAVVEAVLARRESELLIELLTPDFNGDQALVAQVARSGAHVLGHNLETVRRLSPAMRDQRCDYHRSLAVLAGFRRANPEILVKSSLLVGIGETDEELLEALADLRQANVDWVTLGQYLQPSRKNAPVARYVPPEGFEAYAEQARAMGFELVTAGPLVRSSYRAAEADAGKLIAARKANNAVDRPDGQK